MTDEENARLSEKMKDLYFEYTKIRPIIKKYHEKITKNELKQEELSSQNAEISRNINKFDKLSKEISNILKENYENQQHLEPFYSKLNSEYKNNNENYKKMIIEIERKCQSVGIEILDDTENKKNNFQRQDSMFESIQIGTGKLMDRKKLLEERDKELREAQIVAAQIKDVAQDMNKKVQQDNEAFDQIDDNVNQMETNVDSAVKNIQDIRNMQKTHGKRLCCICWMIIFVVFSLVAVIVGLFWDSIKKLINK